MRRAANALTAALLVAACGGKDAPPAADAAPKDAATAAAPDTAPPPSPVAGRAALLDAALADAKGVAAAATAAEELASWATANPEAADADAATLLAARLRLAVATATDAQEERVRHLRVAAELAGAVKDEAGAAVALAARSALALDPTVSDATASLAETEALIEGGDSLAAQAARAAWTESVSRALQRTSDEAPYAALGAMLAAAGPVLCPGCAEAGTLAPGTLERFLLKADAAGGVVCKEASSGADDASTNTARAALLAACPGMGAEGAAEPALGTGANALYVGLLRRAARLAAAPAVEGALAPVLAQRQAALAARLEGVFTLPDPVIVEPLPEEGERAAEVTAPAPVEGLGFDGLAAADLALDVAVVGPDGVRVGVRPTLAVADGKVVSRSKASGQALDRAPALTLDALAEAEVDEETGAVEALVSAAESAKLAADAIRPAADGPRAVSVVVDAEAPSAAVVKTLDSLRSAGFGAFRFVRTAAHGSELPLHVRVAPDPLPEAVDPRFERPIIVAVGRDAVDVWAPDAPVGAPPPSGDADAAMPSGVQTGYRGKALVRLRIQVPDSDERGLTSETLKKVADAAAYWRRATGAGPLLHVAAAAEDSRAADVLRVARVLQAEGDLDVGAVWPGATCMGDDADKGCAGAVAIAFSAIAVPSSWGITATPKEAKPKPPPKPKPSPEFCNERDIKSRMAKKKRDFRFCYESQLRLDDKLEGRVPMVFTIALDGSTTDVRIGKATLKNAKVQSCLRRTVDKMRFAKPDGGECLVRWPFVFQKR